MADKHLWEVQHSHHCSETNYDVDGFVSPPHGVHKFDSWADFVAEWGDADPGYNLVFRWDWKLADDADDRSTDELFMFWKVQLCEATL